MFDVTKRAAYIVNSSKPLVDWLLSMNTHNRVIRPTHVAALQREIANGDWEFTNQGIGISVNGVLNDGQHRLMAIASLGYPELPLLIVTGLTVKAQAVVDRSAKRSQADVIRLIMNRTVSNQAVGAINVIFNIKVSNGAFITTSRQGRTSDFKVAEYLAENIEVFDKVLSAAGSSLRVAVVAALAEYAMRFSLESACELAEQIKSGVGLMVNDPAYMLRQYLMTHKGSGATAQLENYALTVTACIAHAKGEKLGLLKKSGTWDRLPKTKKEFNTSDSLLAA